MKKVPIFKDQFALVDDDDFDKVAHFKWHKFKSRNKSNCYAKRNFRVNGVSRSQLMHRVILGVTDSKTLIDHINGNGLDNRKQNLRICSNAQNSRNRDKVKNNSSGFKGVSYNKKLLCFESKIGLDNKTINLGLYRTEIEAAIAYNEAAVKYHGQFARLNNISFEQQAIKPERIKRTKTCDYHGVFYVSSIDRWRATFVMNKQKYYIGQFKNAQDAAIAYNKKIKELNLPNSMLNKV